MSKSTALFSAIVLFSTVTLTSCSGGAVEQPAHPSTADLMSAAEQLDSSFLVAFNQGDVEAIMKLHWNNPELRSYPPGEPQLSGYDAVKAAYARDFGMFKGAKLEYTSANNILFADGVVGHGTFRWTMPMEGSEPMVMEGRYTEVKAMKDGRMVITVDHTSAPMPAPEEAPVDSTGQQ
jgi:ketosteroid isomerase-like protein